MASLYTAEKFFFGPRRRIDDHTVTGSSFIPRDSSKHPTADTDRGCRHRPRYKKNSIRQLRKVVKGKVSKSSDQLPPIEQDIAFNVLNRTHVLRKSESVALLDTLPNGSSRSKVPRLYRSQPSLIEIKAAERTHNKRNQGPNSMPSGIQYIGMAMDKHKLSHRMPKAKDNTSTLPNIVSGQIKFGDDLMSDENEQYYTDTDEDDHDEDVDDDKKSQKSETEVSKMLKEHQQDAIMAERDVQSDWVLQNEIDNMQKKFERRKKHLKIKIADEDPMVVIEKRLQEVKQMTKVKREQRQVLERFAPEVQEMIMKYKDIPISQIRDERRKKGNKMVDRLRRAVGIVRLLLRGFRGTTRYYLDTTNVSELRKKMETMVEKSNTTSGGRASIGYDMQTALTTQPHLRTRKDIKQILWILRATKAFKHLFPAEMETEVARMVAYERYDDGRIIAYQSRTPDRFYYTLSGRVNLLRQYKLSTGQMTKSMGFMTKGSTTDPQEVDQQWMREDSLIAKGQVEVLLFDKKSFSALQHTTDGPPLDFIQSLHLFLEFPVQRFLNSPEAIDVKYFGQGKIIVKDSNRTPWIHIVKSGLVKVVRRQSVVDARLSNESKFIAPTADHLGCGKPFSHAEAMLGVQAKQKKVKATLLPQIEGTDGVSHNPFANTLGINQPVIFRHDAGVDLATVDEANDDEFDENLPSENSHLNYTTNSTLTELGARQPNRSVNLDQDGDQYEPHDLWLTREKTGQDTIPPRMRRKTTPKRRAYLQLDMLRPGDVFGLDHLQQTLASEPVGVSLLSDGAEVIKISKRFFLQNAENNTMLKVETMYKEYLSEKEAKDIIYHKETWDQYKSALWYRMTAPSPIPAVSKR